LQTYSRRAFSVAGPSAGNSLLDARRSSYVVRTPADTMDKVLSSVAHGKPKAVYNERLLASADPVDAPWNLQSVQDKKRYQKQLHRKATNTVHRMNFADEILQVDLLAMAQTEFDRRKQRKEVTIKQTLNITRTPVTTGDRKSRVVCRSVHWPTTQRHPFILFPSASRYSPWLRQNI